MVLTCLRSHLLFIMHFFVAALLLLVWEVCRSVLTSARTPPHKFRLANSFEKKCIFEGCNKCCESWVRSSFPSRCRYFLDLKAGKWPLCAEMGRLGFRFVFWQDKRSFPLCRGQRCLNSFLIRFWSECFQAAKTFPQWLNRDEWSCVFLFVSRERLCHCRQWPLCACVCGAVLVLFCEPLFPSSWRPPLVH